MKELVAEVRARCVDPAPVAESALVGLWRREIDGMGRRAIIDMGIHGPELAARIAAEALAAGVTPSVVADAMEECDRRYGPEDT